MNRTLLQSFHWYTPGDGTLYDHIVQISSHLKNIGITDIWFPPAYKGASGKVSVGYDPYDLFDLGEFDQKGTVSTKYGNKKQYIDACQNLRSQGFSVIVDIVMNHKAGGDELETFQVVQVDPNNRDKAISGVFTIQSYTKFTFPGRGTEYSNFIWNFDSFSGVDYAVGRSNGIYRIINEFDKNWENVISKELGNYDYLMYDDINHDNPYVCTELKKWANWYHAQIQFDGVRIDAVKHQSPQFYVDWLADLRSKTGKDLFAVGELWSPGHLNVFLDYIKATDADMRLFDATLQSNLHNASKNGSAYDLRKIFDGTLVQILPKMAVTLVANHDTQPLQALESTVDPWFKPIAYALILLREQGIPCVFYPDLYGAKYRDKGHDGNFYDIEMPIIDGLEKIIYARKRYAYGVQCDYFHDANCVGWTRIGTSKNEGCAVVISNKDCNSKLMEVGTHHAGQFFYDLLERIESKVQIDETGWGNFPCPPGNVSVWVPAE